MLLLEFLTNGVKVSRQPVGKAVGKELTTYESGGPSVSETGLVRGRQLSLLWTYVPYSSQCI